MLLDFGSARQALFGETRTLTTLVSPGYAPFEQYHARGDKQGPWTDIYGLGATLYRAVTGAAPMDAIERSEASHSAEASMTSASELGRGVYTEQFLVAIDHALAFRPEDRPQSIQEWEAQIEGEPVPAELAIDRQVLTDDDESVTESITEVGSRHRDRRPAGRAGERQMAREDSTPLEEQARRRAHRWVDLSKSSRLHRRRLHCAFLPTRQAFVDCDFVPAGGAAPARNCQRSTERHRGRRRDIGRAAVTCSYLPQGEGGVRESVSSANVAIHGET